MTSMYAADRLLAGYASDSAVQSALDAIEIIVVPVVNPDGYEYSWTDNRLWRKNRRPVGTVSLASISIATGISVGDWTRDRQTIQLKTPIEVYPVFRAGNGGAARSVSE